MPKANINGTKLYYQLDTPSPSVEAGEKPVLVLANGIFQRVEAWEPLMPHLAGFTVLRYDMRGQGRSTVPEGAYTPDLHTDDLEQLLEYLNIESYSLLGLSNGGIVAQVHASRQPKGLQKLILLCTVSRLDPILRAKVETWQLALEWGETKGRLRIALPWIWGRAYLEAHPELLTEAALETMLLAAPTVQAQKNLMAGFFTLSDLRPQLSNIHVPTLILSGEEDLLFPPIYGIEIAEAIVDSRFEVLPKVGHVAAVEDTPLLMQKVIAFLEERL